MDTLLQDLRYAARSLRRSPGFTAAAVITLALGLGGTTAIFSLINALLLRPLPVHEPDRLVTISAVGEIGNEFNTFSYPDYADLREGTGVLSGLASYGLEAFSLGLGEEARATVGAFVSDNYFGVLGVQPTRGRFFAPEDGALGAAPVAVLGWDTWQQRFGADPAVIGRRVRLNGKPVTVIGVAPRGFNGTINVLGMDVWVPLASYPQLDPGGDLDTRNHMWLQMVGRLAPGVSHERAEAALSVRARQFSAASPPHARMRGIEVPPLRGISGSMRTGALGIGALLLATALLVLGIASVNVAGMLLARTAVRRREVAIRLAMGAGRGRLIRQLLTESTLLWVLGGLGGVLLAAWLGDLLPALVPQQAAFPVRFALDLGIDGRVFAFALGLSLLTGVIFGLAPALRASRPDLVPALKDAAEPKGGRSRLRDAFVVGQVATSLLLLIGAGLFLRTLLHTSTVDPGFDPDGVAVAAVDLEAQGYAEPAGREFYRTLLERLRAAPGVEAASLASFLPLSGNEAKMSVWIDGYTQPDGEGIGVEYTTVAPDYFRILRIPLLRGRGFSAADRVGAPGVAVISESMALRFWPGADPLGKQIRLGPNAIEIVGVAGEVQTQRMGEAPKPFLYLPFGQSPVGEMNMHVLVRTAGGVGTAAGMVRREARALDPDLPLTVVAPLREMIVALMPQRIIAPLIGTFGLVGLLLAAVGVYGVVAYRVAQRTREIGIRMALGARTGDVLRLVLRRGMALVGIGVALGLVAALGLTRLLDSLLVGVSPTDPVTFVAVPLLLAMVALLASYLPARRAARVDPMVALRAE